MKQLLQIFSIFFKIGAFTFGGGFAMIPLIEKEVAGSREWVKKEEFIDIIALAQSMPGPIAINTAVFVGYKLKGIPGAIVAVLGAALPSFLVIVTIAIFFTRFNEYPLVQKFFAGIRPTVVALLTMAVISVGKNVPRTKKNIGITAAFTLLLLFFKLHPIIAIVGGAFIGIMGKDKGDVKNDPV